MGHPLTIDDREAIEHALRSPDLVPHRSADPSTGSTLTLRSAMARFSAPDRRRSDLDPNV